MKTLLVGDLHLKSQLILPMVDNVIKDNNVKGDLSQHSLRHTYATRCIEGNMPPKVLQTLLGHADIRITLDTYSNVFESFQAENVAKVDNYLSDLGIAI